MKIRTVACLVGALALAWPVFGTASAQAVGGGGKDVCAHVVSPADVTRGLASSEAAPSAGQAAAAAAAKQKADTPAALQAAQSAADPAADARKRALIQSGQLVGPAAVSCAGPAKSAGRMTPYATSGSGYSYISWLYQYGEVRNSFCGPAAVEVASATTPGPSPIGLDQYTIANYLASDVGGNWTTIDARGTNTNEEVNGLNHYVGQPDYGWNYFLWAGIDYTPTSAQRSAFISDVKYDVAKNTPVTGDAYEVTGGPHLVGHPNQTIFHYFSIGGWNDNSSQVWYSDPATTVWSSVPAYSWYDTYTMGTILGGRGYVW